MIDFYVVLLDFKNSDNTAVRYEGTKIKKKYI
jgi:hypothetical protein